jgi:hypothetical protein
LSQYRSAKPPPGALVVNGPRFAPLNEAANYKWLRYAYLFNHQDERSIYHHRHRKIKPPRPCCPEDLIRRSSGCPTTPQ